MSWDVILEADAADHKSRDWENLQHFVTAALPHVEQRLRSAKKTCLALHPGLLARYGHMNLIGAFAADVGRKDGPPGLWVLAPAHDALGLPTIDEVPIPITNPSQHTRLTSAWLRNQHRAATAHPLSLLIPKPFSKPSSSKSPSSKPTSANAATLTPPSMPRSSRNTTPPARRTAPRSPTPRGARRS